MLIAPRLLAPARSACVLAFFSRTAKFVDPAGHHARILSFDGRIVEDFKLSTGTFVSAGPLRGKFLSHCAPYAHDAVIAGHDRDFVTVLVFPALDACRELAKLPATASAAETVANPACARSFKNC